MKLLDRYAEARIVSLRGRLTGEELMRAVVNTVNAVNQALWTLPEAKGKAIPIQGTPVRLEVSKEGLFRLERLLKEFASGGLPEEEPGQLSKLIGSLRNAILINLGKDYLPTDSDRFDKQEG